MVAWRFFAERIGGLYEDDAGVLRRKCVSFDGLTPLSLGEPATRQNEASARTWHTPYREPAKELEREQRSSLSRSTRVPPASLSKNPAREEPRRFRLSSRRLSLRNQILDF